MKKYLSLIFLSLLSACSGDKPSKPSHFICITAFGTTQFDQASDAGDVSGKRLRLETEDSYVYVDKSMCVEVQEK